MLQKSYYPFIQIKSNQSNQIRSFINQIKSNQINSNQIKSIKSNQIKSIKSFNQLESISSNQLEIQYGTNCEQDSRKGTKRQGRTDVGPVSSG